jgi:hypothetical protein
MGSPGVVVVVVVVWATSENVCLCDIHKICDDLNWRRYSGGSKESNGES